MKQSKHIMNENSAKPVSAFLKWRSLIILALAVAIVVIDGTVLYPTQPQKG